MSADRGQVMKVPQRKLRSDVRESCLPNTHVITIWDEDNDTVVVSILTQAGREVAERVATEMVLDNLDKPRGRTIYGWVK